MNEIKKPEKMNHKAGDRVRIRPMKWIEAQKKNVHGSIEGPGPGFFVKVMFEYAGREAVITKVCSCGYLLDIDKGIWYWSDWMFDPDYSPSGEPLSPEDAIRAMLDGETLYDDEGCSCIWNKTDKDFQFWYEDGLTYKKCTEYSGLYRRPEKRKRHWTNWECLIWAESSNSKGWVVRVNKYCDWHLPQAPSYGGDISRYQRAQLLHDSSGINESTICGFEVEIC
jgi:hypothetical protein